MRLTIIVEDKSIGIDGVFYFPVDLTNCGIPANVHALQWHTDKGWIEFTDKPNEDITVLPQWALACIEVWNNADYLEKNPPPPSPEEAKAIIKRQAEKALENSDWSQLPDVPLANKDEWTAYRSILRQIATNPSETSVLPAQPEIKWL